MSDPLGENLPFANKRRRLKIWLWLLLLGTVAGVSSRIPWLDGMLIYALFVTVITVITGHIIAWIWDSITLQFECVRPDPVPPCSAAKARYWPGSPMDRKYGAPTEVEPGGSASEEDDGA
jgi:hypothetical protein